MKKQSRAYRIFAYIILILGVLLILFPMYLTVVTALKRPDESAVDFFGLPSTLYLGNFKEVLAAQNYGVYVRNSSFITFFSLLGILVFVPMVSYSISRNQQTRYFRYLYRYLLVGLFVPFQVIMLPVVTYMNRFGLTNQLGLVILYIALSFAQGTFLCVGYLKSVPMEMEEAAHIDGCSAYRTYGQIILPLMRPIIVTVGIMDALWIWNDFQLPLVMLNLSQAYWTLPLFQYNFKGQYSFDYNLAFAAFLISMLPIVIAYSFLQRHIIGGLTEGAIKS